MPSNKLMINEKSIIASLPKVELHLHLDCSLSFEVVHSLQPQITEIEYLKDFNIIFIYKNLL